MAPIVILGSGVIGLTIAHLLAHDSRTVGRPIIIVSRDGVEDLHSQAFASPWAGANWSPIGGYNTRTYRWESSTFNKLWSMAEKGLAVITPSRIFYDSDEGLDQLWYKDLVKNFKVLSVQDGLPLGTQAAVTFDTVAVNPATYLPWLRTTLDGKDVKFVRRYIRSLDELSEYTGLDGTVINASGLGSRSLLGVEDTTLYPIRGQTIAIDAPGVTEFRTVVTQTLNEQGEVTYVLPRTADGSVLLGGTYQANVWDTSIDASTADGILERCRALTPSLEHGEKIHILAHGVGLRPARKGGPRVETEWIEFPLQKSKFPGGVLSNSSVEKRKVKVVHAYGFGGAGYQNSWGAAQEVVELVIA